MTPDPKSDIVTIMKFLFSFLRYLGLFIIVCVFTVLGSSTVLSYYTAHKLTHIVRSAPESEPNLISVLNISNRYLRDLREFELLLAQINDDNKVPSICSTLCLPSSFEMDQYKEDRMAYLKGFYKNFGAAALRDPEFLMRLKEFSFVNGSIPPSVRSILDELSAEGNPSTPLLALQLEGAFLAETPFLRRRYENTLSGLESLETLRKLAKSCERIPNPESLSKECEASGLDAL